MALPANDGPPARDPYRWPDAESGRLRIDEVAHCLVVSVGPGSRRGSMVARGLPAESDRIAVVVPEACTNRIPELVERLWQWVPGVWESVRLVMANAALPVGDDRPPAQQLAEMLGVEVIAPTGRLLAVPDGSLFVAGGTRDAVRAVWSRFRPGRPAEAAGRRFPAPEWEADLAGFVDPGIPGVDVEEVPAGLWVRWSGRTGSNDLGFAVPIQPSTMALLVSRAGDPPLRNADMRSLLQSLPVALWDSLTVVPYGDEPISGARLGAVVAVATNRVVPVRTGLPVRTVDGGVQVLAIGRDGAPTWSPFAHLMAWRPHGGARLLSWTAPARHLMPVGPGYLRLDDRWLVEVIEAGLWLREIDRSDGAAMVRQLPVRSRYCTVVVGGFDATRRPPWRALVKLVQQLPSAARSRLRLAVPDVASERMVKAAARICRRKLRDRPVYLLSVDGELVRHAVAARQRPRRSERETPPGELEFSRPIRLPGGYRDVRGVPIGPEGSSGWPAPSSRDTAKDSPAVPAEDGRLGSSAPARPSAASMAEPAQVPRQSSAGQPALQPETQPPAVPAPEGGEVGWSEEPADP